MNEMGMLGKARMGTKASLGIICLPVCWLIVLKRSEWWVSLFSFCSVKRENRAFLTVLWLSCV